MKFALISNVLPPTPSAQSVIIQRLLSDLPPESYCLLSSRDYPSGEGGDQTGRLPGRYYHLPPPYQLTRGHRFGLKRLRDAANLALAVVLHARAIARILRRERCDSVVVCTGGHGGVLEFPGAYLASLMTGARFYAYLLDQYAHMLSYVLGDSFLRRLESPMLRGAAAVIAPNEFMRDELRRRYGVEAVLIRNACDLSAYEGPPPARAPDGGDEDGGEGRAVVYTGAVSDLHYGAFRNLVDAIESLGRRDVRLHLYTSLPREYVESQGIRGPVVVHEHEPPSSMAAVQRSADVLFLPLGFETPHHDIIRTAAPGKMGEFLAARRPILVHAPADSFISWYFRQHDCGLVIDCDDAAALARALDRLLSDRALRERLIERAWERAREDFALPKARAQFEALLGTGTQAGGSEGGATQ